MRIISMVLLLLIIFPFKGSAEDKQNIVQVDLAISPAEILFDISNMKPGDSVSRELLVVNNGADDFKYILENNFMSGDRVLYNQFDLIIEDNNGIVFEGKLNKFSELAPRLLKSKNEENLSLFIKMPIELGNEFQGLSSDFQFKIYVEGTMGGVIPVDNRLPDTATNMFNYLLAGVALIGGGITLFMMQRKRKLDTKR